MRELISLSPLDPNNPDPDESTDVFLRGSTPAPIAPESVHPPEREYTIAVWVLSALLVILSAVLVFVVAHIIYNHRRLRTLTLFPRRRQKAIQERIERRYETVEGWIISKRVQEHTDFCQTCVKDFSTFNEDEWVQKNATMETAQDSHAEDSGSEDGSDQARVVLQSTSSPSTTEDDPLELESAHTGEKECPICFEEFAVGQVISYSANPSCGHVFHHECIKEWLVHHVTCPFCRKVCMHVDEYRGKQKHEHIEELLELHSKRSATTYFCIQEGLVTIPCRIRCTNSELKRLQGRICDCIVDRKELATMRGGNPNNTAGQDDAGDGRDETEPRSLAQDAVLNLETGTEIGEDDYDPTEDVDGQLVGVYAQGNLESNSIGRQVTVERVEQDEAVEEGKNSNKSSRN
uniref:RING-type domain-containing protein n=1 Tax=Amphora coffeiformis TaxID=265554 RepID=A0A7S3KVH3_9STRA